MILHPDGRIEGTPLEIIAYKKLTSPASSRQDDSEERLKKAMEVEGPAKSFNELAKEIVAAKTPIPSGKQEAVANTFLKGIPWVVSPNELDTTCSQPGSVTPVPHMPDINCDCGSCRLATKYLRNS